MSEAPILLTGGTGYVGGQVLEHLRAGGVPVRCLVRDPGRARLPAEVDVRRGDLVSGAGVEEALAGTRLAYYLVHTMGRGNGPGDFAARDREAAARFGAAAARAGVSRVVYLGGLGPTGAGASEHLRSRHETAEALADRVEDFVYARAAMVIGAGSASFQMLQRLVERLPAMIAPRWLQTRSQPIAIADVAGALARLAERTDISGEVQLGGADVLTYREMLDRYAALTGRRPRPTLPVPVLTPRLSSYWVTLVTRVELGLAQPLVEGLQHETVVERPPPAGVHEDPTGFDDAVRAALAAR